jgi:hypothetical protein
VAALAIANETVSRDSKSFVFIEVVFSFEFDCNDGVRIRIGLTCGLFNKMLRTALKLQDT